MLSGSFLGWFADKNPFLKLISKVDPLNTLSIQNLREQLPEESCVNTRRNKRVKYRYEE